LICKPWRQPFTRWGVHLTNLLSVLGELEKYPALANTHGSAGSAALGQVGKPELLLSLSLMAERLKLLQKVPGPEPLEGFPSRHHSSALLIMVGITGRQQLQSPETPDKLMYVTSVSSKMTCVSADITRGAVFSKATVLRTAETGRNQHCSQKKPSFEPSSSFVPSLPHTRSSEHKCLLQPRFWTKSEN